MALKKFQGGNKSTAYSGPDFKGAKRGPAKPKTSSVAVPKGSPELKKPGKGAGGGGGKGTRGD